MERFNTLYRRIPMKADELREAMLDRPSEALEILAAEFRRRAPLGTVGDLFAAFDDALEPDTSYSLAHGLERMNLPALCEALVNNLAEMERNAPSWAVTMHMRLLNSEEALTTYATRLQRATSEETRVVLAVLTRVEMEEAEFSSRVSMLRRTLATRP
jgi:hypothetical protein